MRRGFLTALVWSVAGAALVQAEPSPVVESPAAEKPAGESPVPVFVGPDVGAAEEFWSAPPPPCPECEPECHQRVWFNADFLLWWVRRGPIGPALVTTGSPADSVPGALDQPGTSVVFGNGPVSFGTFSGVRLGGGFDLGWGWIIEGNYFALERRAAGNTFTSDANGNPLIARPFFDDQAGAPGASLDSLPGTFTGGVSIADRTRLQGYELNVSFGVYHNSFITVELLTGFRALQLVEDLQITDNVTALNPGQLTFLGGPADPPNSLTIFDQFSTYNTFYGGQLGGRVLYHLNSLELGVTGKVALGTTQQLAILNGNTTLNTPGASPTTNPGGILVQPTNLGRYFQNTFGVVPEFGLNLGYWLTPQIRIGMGYQFLYWNRVARPGNVIDTNVNAAQVARDPRFGNGLGDPVPGFGFHSSAFWAQGINWGVLFQY
jgi:hypothetical protein